MVEKFKLNQSVLLIRMQAKGTIVEVIGEGPAAQLRYKVLLGSLTVLCKASELQSTSNGSSNPSAKTKPKRQVWKRPVSPPKRGKAKIDLHGKTVEEALHLFEAKLSEAVIKRIACLEVVHGRGMGKLQQAIHTYLKVHNIGEKHYLDPKNPGVTLVWL